MKWEEYLRDWDCLSIKVFQNPDDPVNQSITLKKWFPFLLSSDPDILLMVSGDHHGITWYLKIEDNWACYAKKSEDEWLYLGALHKISPKTVAP